MTSNINTASIQTNYPIAGKDNNTQGFRDNFTNIVNNLNIANQEITDLQNHVVLKSQLTGGGTINNDFGHATSLSNAIVNGFTHLTVDLGAVITSLTLDFTAADVVKATTNSPLNVILANPPAANFAKIVACVTFTSVSHTLTFPSAVKYGVSSILGLSNNVFTPAAIGTFFFELTTTDGGQSYSISMPVSEQGLGLGSAVAILQANIATLNTSVSALQATSNVHTSNIATLTGNVSTLGSNISILQSNVATINSNITSINSSITSINSSITTIQNTTVKNNTANNLAGNIIGSASKLAVDLGAVIGATTINATAADFYKMSLSGNVTLDFTWPAITNAYAKVRVLAIVPAGVSITFPSQVSLNTGLQMIPTITKIQDLNGQTLTCDLVSGSGYFMFEFSRSGLSPTDVFVVQLLHP